MKHPRRWKDPSTEADRGKHLGRRGADLSGRRFGKLTVIRLLPERRGKAQARDWECLCDCGGSRNVISNLLISGEATHCKACRKMAPADYRRSRRLTGVRNEAKRRGLSFDLDAERAMELIRSPCFYCGLPSPDEKPNGIDRRDNSEGYTEANSVPCCWDCNRAKGTLPEAEFRQWIDRLVSFTTRGAAAAPLPSGRPDRSR